MTRELRAGLIGLGQMGRLHARALRSIDGVRLVAAVDPAGDRFRATDGIPVLPDLDALLHLGVDYAVLATPTQLHQPLGVALAAADIPTLIEKPLAENPTAAQQLVDEFRRAGLPAAVGHIERFNPALIAMTARLREGQLGDIFEIGTRRTGPFPPRITDVGVIHDLATHDFDLTTWITGQRYASIAARTTNRSGRPHEDLLAALGQLTDGTIAHHRVNWISPVKERTTIVTGDRGYLIADTLTADLTYCANGSASAAAGWDSLTAFPGVTEGDTIRYAVPKKDPLLAEHEDFRDTILGHHPSAATLQHALHAVFVAHTTLAAARTGATLAVAPQLMHR